MKSTVFMFLLTAVMIIAVPLKFLLFTSLYTASMVVIWDYCSNNRNWANIIILTVSFFICMVYYVFEIKEFLPYTGGVFYIAVFLLASVSALIKRPFTLKNPNPDPSEYLFHIIMDWIIALANFLALILSFVLSPHLSYIFVPLLLSISSVLFSHYLVKYIFYFYDLDKKLSV